MRRFILVTAVTMLSPLDPAGTAAFHRVAGFCKKIIHLDRIQIENRSASFHWKNINVYGLDERELPQATTFTKNEDRLYSGIAQIGCETPNGKAHYATAFHVGQRTLVTNAHVLFYRDPDTDRLTRLNTGNCIVYYRDKYGNNREQPIRIARSYTRWDKIEYLGDVTNDVALIELRNIPKTVYTNVLI